MANFPSLTEELQYGTAQRLTVKELKSYNKFKTSLKVHIQNDLHLVG